MGDRRLKDALASGQLVAAPGVYDMISALVADRIGFQALYVSGYGVAASHLGLPDAGIATYTDMIDRIGRIAGGTKTPVIADADTGYGGLLNVHHTVRGYEAAGVSAIQLEDQEFPKKCGHTQGRRVVPAEDMVKKIQVALDARRSDDFLIIARTDSRTSLGLDEALRRADAYAEAGADLIFVESPETVEEMEAIAARIDKPLVANMVTGGRTPFLSGEDLSEIGFSLAIYPGLGYQSAAEALRRGYEELKSTGNVVDAPMHDFNDFCHTLGFEDVWAFDEKWAETE